MVGEFNSSVIMRGAGKLTRDNLKVVWAKFSTLSLAVIVMIVIPRHIQAIPHLELKAWPRFRPVHLSLSQCL